jgi:vitamin K-dependent gamma-carboxylase
MLQHALTRLLDRMLKPIDVAWLAAFRIMFGLAMCVSMLRFIGFNWIDAYFVKPAFHFKYYGFAWVEPLPGPQLHALFWVLAALALCVALGLFYRVAAWGFTLGFVYVQLLDTTLYLNHYYLAALLSMLLACSPAHRAWSLDAWRKPELRSDGIATGFQWLFRFQIGVVYTFAGLAKATEDWLVHHQPLRIWLGSHTDMPVMGVVFRQLWAAPVMSWAGFLFDTTIVWWLLYRRTRPFAYAVLLAFHAMTSALFPIGMFPVIMSMAALAFFSPSWPRGLLDQLGKRAPAPQLSSPAPSPRTVHRFALAAGALYGLVQLALPMRYVAYGGNVLWHEQGMRFSWRVMVREKNGNIELLARDKATGQQRIVSPRRYLTREQESEMWGQPDLILQLAQHVHRSLEASTGHRFEVRADAQASLNGRKAHVLIDPTVDLATVQDSFAPAPWIMPAPTEPPPHLRPVRRASIAKSGRPSTHKGADLLRLPPPTSG